MTLDQQITHAAARVAIAVSNGEEDQVTDWTAEVTRLLDQRDRLSDAEHAHIHSDEFTRQMSDALKGSPDHSVVRHA